MFHEAPAKEGSPANVRRTFACKLDPAWQQGTPQCQPRPERIASAKTDFVLRPLERSLFALPVEGLDEQRLDDFVVAVQSECAGTDRYRTASARDRNRGIDANGVTAFPGGRAGDIFALAADAKTRVISAKAEVCRPSCHGSNPAR